MSRFRRVLHGMVSGYAGLIVASVYALASIPLALHYLSKELFGLWALMSTIGGYLSLVDLGMSGSVARLLIDHKDDQQGGTYGSLIKTGALVTITQGAIVILVGFFLAPLSAELLKIPPALQAEFIALLRWQVTGLGFTFATRIFGHVLTAHQRMDITNYGQMGSMVVNFTVQWWSFHAGQGVFSLAWGFICGAFFNASVAFVACCLLPVLPGKGAWGRPSWHYFKDLFGYGKDLFLVALGTQMIMASQTMIITRRLGLEAAATWAVGTRAFNLVYQLISRIVAFTMPAFSEMIVRKENLKLRERFKDTVVLSASVGGFCAVAFALSNSTFVHILTHGKNQITWSPHNDVLLGLWLILLAVAGCHNNLVLATKDIRMMRYIYFIEGTVFVVMAWFTSQWGGLPAVIGSSVICNAVFTFSYGIRRNIRYFAVPAREILVDWQLPMLRVICLLVPVALLTWITTKSLNDYARLAAMFGVSGTIGMAILIIQGLPPALRRELLARSPKPVNGMFQRIFNYR
jgi:O-antigen/teichoic acid export membrane protein